MNGALSGARTLLYKEVLRFWKVSFQTVAAPVLTAAALRWFIERYVPEIDQRSDWRASPLMHPSLAGVAPALVISAEYDPLVDENAAYARRLEAAAVPTRYVCFPGMIHPFFTLGGVVEDAAAAEALIARSIADLRS